MMILLIIQNTITPNYLSLFSPYNMGMVAAGMIDLMASPIFNKNELGVFREFLIKGQRMGRIGNLISTYERELNEKDVTNEIMLDPAAAGVYQGILNDELNEGLKDLAKRASRFKHTFMKTYVEGLRSLHQLHLNMEGIL
jgi:hypothetical protein